MIRQAQAGRAEADENRDAVAAARASARWELVDHVSGVATRDPYRLDPTGTRR